MNAAPLDPETDPLLAKASRRGVISPLLRCRQVKDRLHKARDHTGLLYAEIFPESISLFDFKCNRADFFYAPGLAAGFSERVIGPAMLAPFLANFDACLLHASAVARGGKAAMFLAADEGGKTTAARLSLPGSILGDDQVLLRRTPGGFRAFGTPWGQHADAKLQAPLAGLFMLKKASRFKLTSCPAHELLAHVWQEAVNPLSILPRQLKKKAFAIIADVVASVPAWKLSFSRDFIDWDAIDGVLSKWG